MLGKRESQTRQVSHFADNQFRDSVVLKLFASTKFREISKKSGKSLYLTSAKVNTCWIG